MAQPTTARWTKMTIWPGDGDSPEDFTKHDCGLTSKGLAFSGKTSDTDVPDCDDPDAAVWTERVVTSLSGSATGSGVMATDSLAFWSDWFESGLSKNVRIVLDLPGGAACYFQGAMVLTKFELTANLSDGKIQVSVGADSDGPLTRNDGAQPT
jgi:hypothetical protein